ncbi:hypothetical protein BAJUN_01530 [Bajunvirus bajun]|uniref:Uncharacterized protein n=1 Tax=Brevundimonas phage vB_BgoS-Bajun TaxID=2948594 RepID=A0A9E7N4L0_9CAUD|nr:hypothetical protein BAJUN_01530 [Brevundimonas phage vB_BgoS-Bajun]
MGEAKKRLTAAEALASIKWTHGLVITGGFPATREVFRRRAAGLPEDEALTETALAEIDERIASIGETQEGNP